QVESVLMRYRRNGRVARSSVCVSTQAGCAMRCTFCATGRMGLLRNLSAGEIVAQALLFSRVLGESGDRVTHVTFMGMGEPLANYVHAVQAVRILTHPRAFALGQRSVTVSTVGLVGAIDRLAGEGLQINLAISLHTVDDDLRRRLVPTAPRGSVTALIDAARRYRAKTGRRVTFEYALIEGVNDSPAQARALAKALRRTDAHVNLIPLNPTAGEFRRPPRAAISSFRAALEEAGINATVRSQKGSEISAACGQLRTTAKLPAGR
ncbi:MAG: 23S rRNA (adenine(2503)-C(2))-methyltransferase RlmN, partial [Dehalococcoidia bacterium]